MPPVFTILGARGSRPVCDTAFMRFGGNTTCFVLETEQGPLFIDAGTGLNRYADSERAGGGAAPVTFLFTHFHLDHLAGLPSAGCLYGRNRIVRFMADPERRPSCRETLAALLRPPFWPVALDDAGMAAEYGDLMPDREPLLINGVQVRVVALNHPQGCLGISLAHDGCRVVIATDHEPGDSRADAALTAFAGDADYLLMDAQYTPEQRKAHVGWGHGDWQAAVAMAQAARVGNLILIHHDPAHNDDCLAGIERLARKLFSRTRIAWEGLSFALSAANLPGSAP